MSKLWCFAQYAAALIPVPGIWEPTSVARDHSDAVWSVEIWGWVSVLDSISRGLVLHTKFSSTGTMRPEFCVLGYWLATIATERELSRGTWPASNSNACIVVRKWDPKSRTRSCVQSKSLTDAQSTQIVSAYPNPILGALEKDILLANRDSTDHISRFSCQCKKWAFHHAPRICPQLWNAEL